MEVPMVGFFFRYKPLCTTALVQIMQESLAKEKFVRLIEDRAHLFFT